jgi:hypothetical protein
MESTALFGRSHGFSRFQVLDCQLMHEKKQILCLFLHYDWLPTTFEPA